MPLTEEDRRRIADAIADGLARGLGCHLASDIAPGTGLESVNLVDVIDKAGHNISVALRDLGTGDCGDPRGAIEFLATEIKGGCSSIAEALSEIARAIDEHGRG